MNAREQAMKSLNKWLVMTGSGKAPRNCLNKSASVTGSLCEQSRPTISQVGIPPNTTQKGVCNPTQ